MLLLFVWTGPFSITYIRIALERDLLTASETDRWNDCSPQWLFKYIYNVSIVLRQTLKKCEPIH